MKERIIKLLSVKSIITLLLTLVVVILALKGEFDIRDIYITIISFYFGTQFEKGSKGE